MGFLDFLSAAAPFAAEGVSNFREGQREGMMDRVAMEEADLRRRREEEDRKRRMQMDALNARNTESLIRSREAPEAPPTETFTGQPFEAIGEDGKPGLFIRGSLGTVRPIAGVSPMTDTPKPRTQVVGESIVNLDTGTAEPIKGLPTDGQGRVSAATRTQIAENTATLDLIARARQAVRDRPESFGIRRGISLLPGMGQLGEVINQRTDPEGVTARQLIGNLSSRVIKDRSGAAVTVSEFPRLAAFIPMPYDTPEKILANLDALERELRVVTEALANGATLEELSGGVQRAPVQQTSVPQPRSAAQPTAPAVRPPSDFEAWRATRRKP